MHAFSRLAGQAPQRPKLIIYFFVNPKAAFACRLSSKNLDLLVRL
jgi:hypothetical protein